MSQRTKRLQRRISPSIICLSFFMFLLVIPLNGQVISEPAPPGFPPGLIDAVVTIKTDIGSGTGFVAKFKDRFFIVTNQHVIDGVKKVDLRTRSGQTLRPNFFLGAVDADIALLALPDYLETFPYFRIEEATTFTAKDGDLLIIPGNSLGDGVITSTHGKLLNTGPQRIEVDNPVFPGNSGSPIYHVPSGMVVGVLTEAETRAGEQLDRVSESSIKNEESQIKSDTRYFGHRIDSVAKWVNFDWQRYQSLSNFLVSAEEEISHIESFIFGSDSDYEKFADLHKAVNEADRVFRSDKFAAAEYIKALDSLVTNINTLTFRKIRHLEANPNDFPNPLYRQQLLLDDIKERANILKNEYGVRGRNLDLWKGLLQR